MNAAHQDSEGLLTWIIPLSVLFIFSHYQRWDSKSGVYIIVQWLNKDHMHLMKKHHWTFGLCPCHSGPFRNGDLLGFWSKRQYLLRTFSCHPMSKGVELFPLWNVPVVCPLFETKEQRSCVSDSQTQNRKHWLAGQRSNAGGLTGMKMWKGRILWKFSAER